QHQKLFGQFLEDDIIGEAMAVNQDPEMYYRAKYNISAKEAEIAARIREQEIAKIREEERAKIMAEVTSDPGRLVGQSAFPGMTSSSVQDNYMKQAAQARNPIADTGDQGQRLLPEQKPDLQAGAGRVASAAAFFAKNFNADGSPLTTDARSLLDKYRE